MSLAQVDMLEGVHAYLTDSGWIVPAWVRSLRAKVESRRAIRDHVTPSERLRRLK